MRITTDHDGMQMDTPVPSGQPMRITMDNGTVYELTELRPSASRTALKIRSLQGGMLIEPCMANVVQVRQA